MGILSYILTYILELLLAIVMYKKYFFKKRRLYNVVAAELNEDIGFWPGIFLEGTNTSVVIGYASSQWDLNSEWAWALWLVNALLAYEALRNKR